MKLALEPTTLIEHVDVNALRAEYTPLPSGRIVPAEVARLRLMRPTAVDAFCGCGGFSLGIIQAGFEVLAGIDWDAAAALTYMTNLCSYPCKIHFVDKEAERALEKVLAREFKGLKGKPPIAGSGWISTQGRGYPPVRNFIFGDVTKVTGKDICRWLGISVGELDLLVGSPPCQGASFAGLRDINDTRNDLTIEFGRLACELRPRSICMEQVPGVMSMTDATGRGILDQLIETLESGDYSRDETMRNVLRNRFGDKIVLGRGPSQRKAAKAALGRGPSQRKAAKAARDDDAADEGEAEQMEMAV